MLTSATFVQDFPEFSDTGRFPASMVNFYITLAYESLDAYRWQDRLDYGAGLYIAHHLTLESRAMKVSAFGGDPGVTTGPLTGRNVGGVSQGWDAGSVTIEGDSHWNMTNYGIRFMSLCRIVGAGGIQL